jgi:Icc-related predicted phosphoesterase
VRGVFDVVKERGSKYSGKSIGIDSFREIVEREQPGLVLCGHMHEYQGKERLGKSVIVNPGAAFEGKCAFVDFDAEKGRVKSVEFVE